jgi:hypothetical protein
LVYVGLHEYLAINEINVAVAYSITLSLTLIWMLPISTIVPDIPIVSHRQVRRAKDTQHIFGCGD